MKNQILACLLIISAIITIGGKAVQAQPACSVACDVSTDKKGKKHGSYFILNEDQCHNMESMGDRCEITWFSQQQ